MTLKTFTVRVGFGEVTTHLIFERRDGKRFVVKEVHYEYNPGAFGIEEETKVLKFSSQGDTMQMRALKHRIDVDIGPNEIESEETETRMYCGQVKRVV